MKIKAAIVDDEQLARARLKRLLTDQQVDIVAEGQNGQEALHIAQHFQFDVLFIDINMPVMNGMDAVREISQCVDSPPAIVFCTAYDQFAIDAFNTNAISYLLKPIQAQDIANALKKASTINRIQRMTLMESKEAPVKHYAVHYQGALQNIPASQFAYFHSVEKNVFAVLEDGDEVLIEATLKSLEQDLNEAFLRIHRNALVNKQQVSRLIKDEKGMMQLELKVNAVSLAVSRRHVSEVKKCFQ